MPSNRPGRAVDLIANKLLNHGKPHYQAGLTGVVQKQDQPGQWDALATRTQVQNGIKYVLLVKGEVTVDALAGATLGAPVYIDTVTDALSLADSGTAVPFGRVTALPSQNGLSATLMRVDQDLKDTVPNA